MEVSRSLTISLQEGFSLPRKNEEEEIAPSIHTSGCNLEQEESEINEKFQETENNSPISEEERKNE